MDSYKFSELYDKLREAMNMTENEELKELLDKAIDSILDMQKEVKQENENLSFLGIYTDDISNIIDICEDAVKSVGTDISDYNDMVSIDYSGTENNGNNNITNTIIAEYLYQAENILNEAFEKNGLDIQADSYTNGSDSHLYAGGEEIFSGEDVQNAVLTAVQENLAPVLEKLDIPADTLEESEKNPILGETLKDTIENIVSRIVEEMDGMGVPQIYEENDGTVSIELFTDNDELIDFSGSIILTIGELGDRLEEAAELIREEKQAEQD